MKNSSFFTLIFVLSSSYIFGQTAKPTAADTLPEPYATKSVMNFSNVIGWEKGQKPVAPAGFTVTKYADLFDNPRWVYVLPNGDVVVAESNSNASTAKQVGAAVIGAASSKNMSKSADRITLLRDTDNDGEPDIRNTFLTAAEGLNQPLGMLVLGDWFYVANTDALMRYPYKKGQIKIEAAGQKILDLPAGKVNRHWTRNILLSPDKKKIYVAIGSGDDHGEKGMEHEILKATILEINPDGSDMIVYANGLRNPVGMDWAPGTKTLWTAVNERDQLGDNLVPDYLTHVEKGGFYGWPYSYYGQNEDPRVEEKDLELVKKAIVPDVNLGPHTASLGLTFYTKKAFPAKYRNGAFIAQHGSWNRSTLSGYRVVYVPFKNGKPSGPVEDFLTGFIADLDDNKVYGRPVGLAVLQDGSMLVTDDVTNTIWRVAAE